MKMSFFFLDDSAQETWKISQCGGGTKLQI